MAKPDFSNFQNVIIMGGRQMGKRYAQEMYIKWAKENTPQPYKLLDNQPVIVDNRMPKYPPIPRKVNT